MRRQDGRMAVCALCSLDGWSEDSACVALLAVHVGLPFGLADGASSANTSRLGAGSEIKGPTRKRSPSPSQDSPHAPGVAALRLDLGGPARLVPEEALTAAADLHPVDAVLVAAVLGGGGPLAFIGLACLRRGLAGRLGGRGASVVRKRIGDGGRCRRGSRETAWQSSKATIVRPSRMAATLSDGSRREQVDFAVRTAADRFDVFSATALRSSCFHMRTPSSPGRLKGVAG